MAHSHTGKGLLQVVISGDEGLVALAANVSEPSESSSWVHRSGRFKMHVTAVGVRWRVDVLGLKQPYQGPAATLELQEAPALEPRE